MTDTAPFLTFRTWKGSDSERFRYSEQNRIISNIKRLADLVGVPFETVEVTHADQFSISLQNRMESAIKAICAKVGIDAPMETSWGARRGLTFKDFDRVEDWLHRAYWALDGRGSRIGWDEVRRFDPYLLLAKRWTGTGPYFYDLPTDLGQIYADGLVWVSPEATPSQRASEYNAMITVVSSAEGVRLCAHGIRPREDIPIIITRGYPLMHESVTLRASGWTGNGPWTQTVIMANPVANGVITINEGATTEQAKAFAKAGISVASSNGTSVSIRAVFSKPTVDLSALLIFEESEATR